MEETPVGGNIFADIGFDPEEAGNLKLRSSLMIAIPRIVEDRGLKQREAAELFGTTQSRISDVTRGQIDAFTIDSLVNMLGCRVSPRASTYRLRRRRARRRERPIDETTDGQGCPPG